MEGTYPRLTDGHRPTTEPPAVCGCCVTGSAPAGLPGTGARVLAETGEGPPGGRWSLFPQVLTPWSESQTAARGPRPASADVRPVPGRVLCRLQPLNRIGERAGPSSDTTVYLVVCPARSSHRTVCQHVVNGRFKAPPREEHGRLSQLQPDHRADDNGSRAGRCKALRSRLWTLQ